MKRIMRTNKAQILWFGLKDNFRNSSQDLKGIEYAESGHWITRMQVDIERLKSQFLKALVENV